MEEIGILALIEAKPDKGPDLHALLKSAREAAVAEQGTVSWFAFQVSKTTFGIFDTPNKSPNAAALNPVIANIDTLTVC